MWTHIQDQGIDYATRRTGGGGHYPTKERVQSVPGQSVGTGLSYKGLNHGQGCGLTTRGRGPGGEGQVNTHISGFLALVNGIGQHVGAGHAIAQPHHSCRHQGAEGLPHLIGVAWRGEDSQFLSPWVVPQGGTGNSWFLAQPAEEQLPV